MTSPDNADVELDELHAEIAAWLANDPRTCTCNAQLQPHDRRDNVCP